MYVDVGTRYLKYLNDYMKQVDKSGYSIQRGVDMLRIRVFMVKERKRDKLQEFCSFVCEDYRNTYGVVSYV